MACLPHLSLGSQRQAANVAKKFEEQPCEDFESLPCDSFFVFASGEGTLSVAWRQN